MRERSGSTLWFISLEEARQYSYEQLIKLNENSRIEEEKTCLLPHKPPLELAVISENTVNTSSMICVDTVFYSVPEHLVGRKVIVKKYHDEIRVYASNDLVCKHKRVFGNGHMQVDIYHYPERRSIGVSQCAKVKRKHLTTRC